MQKVEKEEAAKRAGEEEKKKKNRSNVVSSHSARDPKSLKGSQTTEGTNSACDPSTSEAPLATEAGEAGCEGSAATTHAAAANKFRAHHITAKHLIAALQIPKHEAGDLIFIADTENDGEEEPAIDFFEFHELVTNFT
jgi:hypothetical protein